MPRPYRNTVNKSISAIVVVRDGAERLGRALASIVEQTLPPDEILVVDGHSTDCTEAVARSFAGVRFMQQRGTGLADARNSGIAAARGDIVAFLDHDDCWTADKLAVQAPLLDALLEPGYVIARLRLVREVDGRADAPLLARTPGVLLAHKALFERAGGFDETLASGCDMDWFARVAERGVPCAAADRVLLLKHRHDRNLSVDIGRNRHEAFAAISRAIGRRRARRD